MASAPVTDDTEYDLEEVMLPSRPGKLADADRSAPEWSEAVNEPNVVVYDCKNGGVVPLERVDAKSRTAWLHMTGSMCPFTAGHLSMFLLGRDILCGFEAGTQLTGGIEKVGEPYDYVIATVAFNTDKHVAGNKYSKKFLEGDEKVWSTFFTRQDRALLAQAAAREFPWIHLDYLWDRLPTWPGVEKWAVNGADVVLTGRWMKPREIAIGRVDTEGTLDRLKQKQPEFAPDLILTRPLPDVSSSRVQKLLEDDGLRASLRSGIDPATGRRLLHRGTAEMLIDEWETYKGKRIADPAYIAAQEMFQQRIDAARARAAPP